MKNKVVKWILVLISAFLMGLGTDQRWLWVGGFLLICLPFLLIREKKIRLDYLASKNKLYSQRTELKVLFFGVNIITVLFVRNLGVSLFVIISVFLLIRFLLNISFEIFINALRIPSMYLLLSMVALKLGGVDSFEVINISLMALASFICLLFFNLSTPLHDFINFLYQMRLPSLVIELMYYIHHYIWVLLRYQSEATTASEVRNAPLSIRNAGYIATGVFIHSVRFASSHNNAMSVRRAEHLRFYQKEKKLEVVMLPCYLELILVILGGIYVRIL